MLSPRTLDKAPTNVSFYTLRTYIVYIYIYHLSKVNILNQIFETDFDPFSVKPIVFCFCISLVDCSFLSAIGLKMQHAHALFSYFLLEIDLNFSSVIL